MITEHVTHARSCAEHFCVVWINFHNLVSTVVIPVLQVRKLRFRAVKRFAQGCPA